MLDFQSPLPDPTVGPYELANFAYSPVQTPSPGLVPDVGRRSGLRILESPQMRPPILPREVNQSKWPRTGPQH
jgi:hypothetical protein